MKIRFNYAFLLHALIWSLLFLVPVFVSNADHGYNVGFIPAPYFLVVTFIHMLLFYFHALYIFPKFVNRRFWWLYILATLLAMIAANGLKTVIVNTWYPEAGRLELMHRFIWGSSVDICVLSFIYSFIRLQIRKDKQEKEKEAARLLTELKFLRSQISPHFLFNTLTNLVSLARKKSDLLEPSLIMLSNLMRYMLYDSQGEKVALGKEVEYLESYIQLQRMRFGNDLDIDYSKESDVADSKLMIEPMLLVPFVENAFKHGTGYVTDPFIRIRLAVRQDTLTFEVSNKFSRDPDESKDEDSGIGLVNVRTRLNMLYKDRHGLKIREEGQLFHITLTLQLQ
jgi:two-component system LytT family sensor kinase